MSCDILSGHRGFLITTFFIFGGKNMAKKKNIIRIDQVVQKISMSKPSIYRMIKAGTFPRQIKISARAIGWIESDIDKWIESKHI